MKFRIIKRYFSSDDTWKYQIECNSYWNLPFGYYWSTCGWNYDGGMYYTTLEEAELKMNKFKEISLKKDEIVKYG